jgi:hypothetical protein
MRRVDATDLLAVVGLGTLGAGLWMIWPALALIVVGSLLLVMGIVGAWLRAK